MVLVEQPSLSPLQQLADLPGQQVHRRDTTEQNQPMHQVIFGQSNQLRFCKQAQIYGTMESVHLEAN